MNGLASEPARRWTRRKWVRYEREYSNSLWHADWYEMKDARWKGMWLIMYEDDASRFIVGYGLFKNATSHNSVEVLKQAIAKYGKPKSILSDRGIQFYAVESEAKENDLIAPLIGSQVYLLLRNGQSLTGLLMKATKYEVFVQTDVERLIIMKHAIDVIKAVENGKS